MREKRFYILFAMEAAICFACASGKVFLEEAVTTVMAFPYEPIGNGLRWLALLGRWGNAVSMMLFTALCLLPVGYLMLQKQRRELHGEDSLLPCLSLILAMSLYLIMNPVRLNSWFGNKYAVEPTIPKAVLGITIDSILFSYMILRILRMFFESSTQRLYRCLRILLYLLNALFVWVIFGDGINKLLEQITAFKAGNTQVDSTVWWTIGFFVLRYLAEMLPYILDIWTVFLAIRLLYAMQEDRNSEAAAEKADALSRWCKTSLMAVIASNIGINVLQFVFADKLRDLSSNLILPVASIVFVLGVLIFSRMASENRQLKEDNDLFI